jgi:hypothetical protein
LQKKDAPRRPDIKNPALNCDILTHLLPYFRNSHLIHGEIFVIYHQIITIFIAGVKNESLIKKAVSAIWPLAALHYLAD